MAGLAKVTREDVLAALERCDRVGRQAFLAETGFQESTRYQISHQGRSYPSKAILGAAAGLRPSDFFGGVSQTVPALQRLGFQIRDGRRVVTSVGTAALAERFRMPAAALEIDPAAYFHSGSNRPGEIRGLSAVGADVGTVALELLGCSESVEALEALDGSDVQVFVDSGAFSEVDDQLQVVRPIDPARWARIMALYCRLGRALGSQLWVVAPDRVGSQRETLARLEAYRPDLQLLHGLGVRILLPLQPGELDLVSFYRLASDVLGFEPIPAFPCKKAATPSTTVADFVLGARPAHVHFLGLGPRNKAVGSYVQALRQHVDPEADPSFSLDSNWIRANVGRQGKPRRFTAARDVATSILGAAAGSAAIVELAMILAHGAVGVTS